MVSIDGDTIVIGAPLEDGGLGDPAVDGGAGYVFHRNHGGAGQWGEFTQIYPSGGNFASDEFGGQASMEGKLVLLGSPLREGGFNIPPSNNVGAAYLFEVNIPAIYLPIIHQ